MTFQNLELIPYVFVNKPNNPRIIYTYAQSQNKIEHIRTNAKHNTVHVQMKEWPTKIAKPTDPVAVHTK